MKTLIDIGANIGQAIKPAIEYGFDKIICFEPSSACLERLKIFKSTARTEIVIHPYGLYNETRTMTLYSPGTLSASVYADKCNVNVKLKEECSFMKASNYFTTLNPLHNIFVKINVEGAECAILEDLMKSGEINKIKHLFFHMDIEKIPSMKHLVAPLREKLKKYPKIHILEKKQVSYDATLPCPDGQLIAAWLKMCKE